MYIVVLKILAIFGGAFISLILACVIVLIKETLDDIITKKRRLYRIKHRFDKPPLAKCYCKDCYRFTYDDPENPECREGKCAKFSGWTIADSWFCWDAYPDIKRGDEE